MWVFNEVLSAFVQLMQIYVMIYGFNNHWLFVF